MCKYQKEVITSTNTNENSQFSPNTNSGNNMMNVGTNTNSTVSSPERDFDENCATNYIISNTNKRSNSNRYQLGNSDSTNNCDTLQERRIRQLRRQADWQWLHACIGKCCRLAHHVMPDSVKLYRFFVINL